MHDVWILYGNSLSHRVLLMMWIRSYFHDIPTVPNMSSQSLLAALETVSVERLTEDILGVPDYKRDELRKHYSNDENFRKSCIRYYLSISPYKSWGDIAGRLLYWEEATALKKVKEKFTPHRGMQLVIWNTYSCKLGNINCNWVIYFWGLQITVL